MQYEWGTCQRGSIFRCENVMFHNAEYVLDLQPGVHLGNSNLSDKFYMSTHGLK